MLKLTLAKNSLHVFLQKASEDVNQKYLTKK